MDYLAVVHSNDDVADLYQTISLGGSATHDRFHIHVAVRFLLKENANPSLNCVYISG